MARSYSANRSASRARAASTIRGSKSFRRLMKQMPDAMREELGGILERTGPPAVRLIQGRIQAATRKRSGRLLAGVKSKLLKRSLRLQVGFLGTPRARSKLFYARILDLGRKAQTVRVTRGRSGRPPYPMRVRAITPKRFVTGGLGGLGAIVGRELRGAWDRGIQRIAEGDE